MKTVGVIIPIYNMKNYLRQCLESVINQSYTNLQVVLVNDGSSDSSLEIAKEYILKDARFVLIDKENGGLSQARNAGLDFFYKKYSLKIAKQGLDFTEFTLCEENIYNIYKIYKASKFVKDPLNFYETDIDYLMFLDSDDTWELNCVKECVSKMSKVQVVWFDWNFNFETKNVYFEHKTYHDRYKFKEGIISSALWLKQYKNTNINWFSFCWNGMICFKHLAKLKLYFIDKTIHEDVFFGISLFLSCDNIFYLPKKLYNYRIRNNSLCDYSNQQNKSWLSPYMKKLFSDFEDLNELKFYHRASSNGLMCIELLNFIKTKLANKPNQNDLQYIINDRVACLWDILHCKKDPLNILYKIPKELYITKLFSFKENIQILEQHLSQKDYTLNTQNQEIIQLKHELNETKSLLAFHKSYQSATQRIHNHLSYKLGQTLIINSKSLLGLASLAFVLLALLISHKQEQKIYKLKVKKNKNLALPPLEAYPDYHQALKETQTFTYKLGQAFLKALKNSYWGGGICVFC